MIWFAWRQFRSQALIAAVLLLALAIAFLVTGPNVVHMYNTTIVGCGARGDCQGSTNALLSAYPFLQNLLTESWLLSVLIGIFWGRASGGARVRYRHLPTGLDAERVAHPVAWREGPYRRARERRHGRTLHVDGYLVVEPD